MEALEGHQTAAGKKLLPGIVSHSTNLIEHPELVAGPHRPLGRDVGPTNVVASTDAGSAAACIRPDAWAKLESLAQGAELATKRLWRRKAA